MQDEWTFEWDPAKDRANRKKHGISFAMARAMWDDPFLVEARLQSFPEERWAAIARLPFGYYTAIVTYRGDSTIRIISVRKSSKKEVEIYAGH